MVHEEVLKSFYARLKGLASDGLTRIVDLAKEVGQSYRSLCDLFRSSGLELFWIGGKAFVCRHEAVSVLRAASLNR
ncbi:hypothetical protein CIG75_17820 [Tumebacillus algifaecis]|uniref:Uncharacterized protein n=1 Tax=Tumebacillus algifaecis TaxID=1214604 RepID=A0A223D5A0_9BACL|nr:hypothetical protein [Tumebacillus algifaecis]ASS76643.1 hypothetical protein CIG75_17820 [Tumebacillus algifaecis]